MKRVLPEIGQVVAAELKSGTDFVYWDGSDWRFAYDDASLSDNGDWVKVWAPDMSALDQVNPFDV